MCTKKFTVAICVMAAWSAVVQAAPVSVASVAELRLGSFSVDVNLAGYYGAATPGGGPLRYDAGDASSADNGCTVFRDGAGHRFKRVAGPLPVSDCGARGDGAADDTAAQQAALNAAPSGGAVTWPKTGDCYRTTAALSVNRPVALSGDGTICAKTPGIGLFSVSGSKVTFDGLTLAGPKSVTYRGNETAIRASGVFTPGKAPQNIKDFTARNLIISDFGGTGIQLLYVDGFLISNNKVHDICFAGVEGLSVLHGTIRDNVISGISANGSPGLNAYGIALTRYTDDSGELVSQPRSAYVTVSGNRISDIPTWEGLDTHSGDHISFDRNTVTNTFFGISVGSSRGAGQGEYLYAPLQVTVTANRLDSGVTDGSRGTGIPFTGAPGQNASGAVTGNTVIGYGHAATAADGAILTYYTDALAITENMIVNPSPNGIAMVTGSRGTIVARNTITDPFTDVAAVGGVQGIFTTGDNNSLQIENNRIMRAGKAAAYLLTSPSGAAIRLGSGKNNSADIGSNQTDATFPLLNSGNTRVRRH